MLKQRAALLAATSTIVLVLAMPFAAAQQAAQAAEQPTGPAAILPGNQLDAEHGRF